MLAKAKCNTNTIHWVYDTWALANRTGKATVQTGGDTWFFITADYAFGYALERDAAAVVEANGGKCWARSGCRSTPVISRRFCSRHKPPRLK
jgi:ABC-type branched-subunit amino acid transport system substrate-binding protein